MGKENLIIAYNIANSNTFSLDIDEKAVLKSPTNLREPLYPFLLSIMINMANSEKSLNCFLSKDECSEIRNF